MMEAFIMKIFRTLKFMFVGALCTVMISQAAFSACKPTYVTEPKRTSPTAMVTAPLYTEIKSPRFILSPVTTLEWSSWPIHDPILIGERYEAKSLDAKLQALEPQVKASIINKYFSHRECIDEKTYSDHKQTALHRVSTPIELVAGYVCEAAAEKDFYDKLPTRQYNFAVVLLKHDADLLIKDSRNRTPMHIAASTGREKFVELYAIHNDECVNARGGIKNSTPLMAAIVFHKNPNARAHNIDNTGCIKVLLSHGAFVNLHDKNDRTALDLALDRSECAELIPMLRAGGAKTAAEIQKEEGILEKGFNDLLHLAD